MTSFARDAKEGTSGVEIYLALFIGGAMTGPLGETVPAKRMRRAFVGRRAAAKETEGTQRAQKGGGGCNHAGTLAPVRI